MIKHAITLTEKQAKFLWAILDTHARVCDAESAAICAAVKKKIEAKIAPTPKETKV